MSRCTSLSPEPSPLGVAWSSGEIAPRTLFLRGLPHLLPAVLLLPSLRQQPFLQLLFPLWLSSKTSPELPPSRSQSWHAPTKMDRSSKSRTGVWLLQKKLAPPGIVFHQLLWPLHPLLLRIAELNRLEPPELNFDAKKIASIQLVHQ